MPSRRATGSQQRLEQKVQGRTRLPRCPMILTSALHHPTYPLTYGPMVFCTDFSVHKIFLTAYDLMAKILHQFICGSLDIRGFDAYKIIQDFSHQLYLYYHISKSFSCMCSGNLVQAMLCTITLVIDSSFLSDSGMLVEMVTQPSLEDASNRYM